MSAPAVPFRVRPTMMAMMTVVTGRGITGVMATPNRDDAHDGDGRDVRPNALVLTAPGPSPLPPSCQAPA